MTNYGDNSMCDYCDHDEDQEKLVQSENMCELSVDDPEIVAVARQALEELDCTCENCLINKISFAFYLYRDDILSSPYAIRLADLYGQRFKIQERAKIWVEEVDPATGEKLGQFPNYFATREEAESAIYQVTSAYAMAMVIMGRISEEHLGAPCLEPLRCFERHKAAE